MATPIKMTEAIKKEILEELSAKLDTMLMTEGKIKIDEAYEYKGQRAKLIYTQKAMLKILSLVETYDSEIAWHGTVERIDDVTWKIKDILIYPQVVTGATVNTDQEEYQEWLESLSDDDINSLRYQGHSHVRMSVSPSGTDMEHQGKILESMRLQKDGYYIFQIINKDMKTNVWIYDLARNIKYDTADIDVCIEDVDLSELHDQTNKLVKKNTPTVYGATSTYSTGGYAVSSTDKTKGKSSKAIKPIAKSEPKGKAVTQTKFQDLYDDDDNYGAYGYTYNDKTGYPQYGQYGWGY